MITVTSVSKRDGTFTAVDDDAGHGAGIIWLAVPLLVGLFGVDRAQVK